MSSEANEFFLYGLILSGGKSARMGRDKGTLLYEGHSQVRRCFELLTEFCPSVFVSCRLEQAADPGYQDFPQIHDRPVYAGAGPLAGILSAMERFPQAAWLVLACDLPFVTAETLRHLIQQRDRRKTATAYLSRHDGLPEPLCAVYEPQSVEILQKFFKDGITCPRKILINSDARLLPLAEAVALDNVNSPEEYQQAMDQLQTRKKAAP